MNGVWKAPPTGSGMTLRAPSSLAMAPASAMASASPAITIWPAPLRLATQTSPVARAQASVTMASSAAEDGRHGARAGVGGGLHGCPRSVTRRTPSARASEPAAVRAEYSPRLCPAATAQVTPRSRTASCTTRLRT